MRFMVIIKSNADSEAGIPPSNEDLEAMGKYNEELVRAGVLLAGEGLLESAKGARVRFANGTTSVIDGPFAEAKELVAGFWLLQVKSKEEAIEWARRVPIDTNSGAELEVRQVAEITDFPDASAETIAREQRLRDEVAGR